MHILCVSHSIFNSGQHFTLSLTTYSSHAAVVPTRVLIAHPPAPALGTYTRWRWSILFWYTGWRWSILYWYTGLRWSILYWYTGWWLGILYSGDVGVEHRSLETCELTCGYPFPIHIQCVSHLICNSGQYFTFSISTYSSHAAVGPTRLLIENPPAPAQGTYTQWRWSILYWYTGWRLGILYSGDVGVEHRSPETVRVDMWLSFPYAYSMRFAYHF